MTIEQGVVVRIENGQTWVRTVRSEACSGCGVQGACHTLGGGKEAEVVVHNDMGAEIGDRVDMEVPTGSVIKATSLMYLVPIFFLLVGAVGGQELAPQLGWTESLSAVIFAVIGLGMSMIIVKWAGKRMAQRRHYFPTITQIYVDLPQNE